MKNLTLYLSESAITEKKSFHHEEAETTLHNFISWYIDDNKVTPESMEEGAELIDALTTDPEDYFDGDYEKLYDFYIKHKDTKITVKITYAPGGVENDFEIENIKFNLVSGDDYTQSNKYKYFRRKNNIKFTRNFK